jgi:hypothetical protein
MSDGAIVAISFFGCVIGLPVLWGIVSSLAAEWRKVRVAEQAAVLKKEMLDRGFTADEIVQVLDAGADAGDKIAGKTPQPSGRR